MVKPFDSRVGRIWIGALGCSLLAGVALGWLLFHSSTGKQATQPLQASAATKASTPPMPEMIQATIPANASPELKEFLENRATLANKMNQMRQQNSTGTPDPKTFAQFQKDNAALLKRQSELAQIMSQQQAKNPMPTPPPLRMPPNASPQLQAFLTARDQVMRDQIAFMNLHRTDDPAVRQAAMQQWHQQNAARFQQLQQLAQNLSKANSPTQN